MTQLLYPWRLLWSAGSRMGGVPPPDVTPPTVTSGTVAANGLTFTVNLSENVNGHTGFAVTLSGGAASLTYVSGEGTSALVFTLSRAVLPAETGTLAYTAGDVKDVALNSLANFSGLSITNSSAEARPTVTSATIAANGTTFTIGCSEAVTNHAGFAVTLSGGAASLTYVSGSGSSSLVFTLSRTVTSTETGTLAYTAGDVVDSVGLAMANFSGTGITNNSTQTPAFSPGDVAGLKLWLESDGTLWQNSSRTTPVTSDGDPVGSWDDASSSANHLLQATSGARLTYKTGIQNGKPALRFDGSDDFMAAANSATIKHWFIVAKCSEATFSDYRGLIGTTSEVGLLGENGLTRWFEGGVPLDSATYRMNGVTGSHGSLPAPMAAWGVISVSYSTGWSAAPQVGRDRNLTRYWLGDVIAVLGYDSVLSSTDRDSVEAYLNSKYAVY